MQKDAVACEALSTPFLRMEVSGTKTTAKYVSISIEGFYPSIPRTNFPKSMSTLAQACCTVPEVSVK